MAEQPNAQLLRGELKPQLEENLKDVQKILNLPLNKDVVLRRYGCEGFEACAIYIEGMADDKKISEFILHACKESDTGEAIAPEQRAERLMESYIEIAQCVKENRMGELITGVLGGMTAVLIDGCGEGLLLETRGFVHRPVNKTSNEAVVIGSQEGFVESLRANITLLRRYVQSAQLVTERLAIGTGVPTNVALMYLKGVLRGQRRERGPAQAPVHRQPERAGNRVIQQFIEDRPRAIFPQMLQTERPDRAASCLLEGQFVILAENSPYALTAPVTMFHLIHASDDTFMRWQYATLLRIVRIAGLAISLFLPGLYVALLLHHTHLIPLTLLLSIAETRADVPFTVLFEVLLMEFSFYLINEAGHADPLADRIDGEHRRRADSRQAAVSASIISPILIILVALTGLGSYAVPNYGFGLSIVVYRLLIVLTGALLGLYGLLAAALALLMHLCSIRSFGVSYLAPVAPKRPHNPDILLRLSIRKQNRPMFYARRDSWLHGKGSASR